MLRLLGPRSVVLVAVACVCGWLAASANAFVYWSNFAGSSVGRAGLDGGGANEGFVAAPQAVRRCRRRALRLLGQPRHQHDWPRQPGRLLTQPELHHRRVEPERSRGRLRPHLLDQRGHELDRPRQPGRNRRQRRASSPAPTSPRASRSTPPTSTGPTTAAARSAALPWLHRAATSSWAASRRTSSPAWTPPTASPLDSANVYWADFGNGSIGRARNQRHFVHQRLHRRPQLAERGRGRRWPRVLDQLPRQRDRPRQPGRQRPHSRTSSPGPTAPTGSPSTAARSRP